MPMGAESMRSPASAAVQLGQRLHQLRRQLTLEHRLGPAVEPDREILTNLHLQLTAFELDHERAGGATEEGGHGGAAGPRARGERLPHAALEDSRPHPAAVDREEGD